MFLSFSAVTSYRPLSLPVATKGGRRNKQGLCVVRDDKVDRWRKEREKKDSKKERLYFLFCSILSVIFLCIRKPEEETGSTMGKSSKTILTLGRFVACVARGQIGV